jgi:hypothetical protein
MEPSLRCSSCGNHLQVVDAPSRARRTLACALAISVVVIGCRSAPSNQPTRPIFPEAWELGAPIEGPPPSWEGARITLHRDECYGWCPAYRVSLSTDGTVRYDGYAFVKTFGTVVTKIDPALVIDLLDRMWAAGFWRWKDDYFSTCTDISTAWLGVRTRDGVKVVTHPADAPDCAVGGLPPLLEKLDAAVDEAAQTSQWVSCGNEIDGPGCDRGHTSDDSVTLPCFRTPQNDPGFDLKKTCF